jgi:hypothetical protein
MITILLLSLSFLSGIYVGARFSDKLLAIWHSITGK